jgi:hypothetical protein
MSSHINTGKCPKCEEIFAKYPGFNEELHEWFKGIQAQSHDCHISCAGRGSVDQEVAFKRGASKAHYGQSSHNFNAAIDLFQLVGNAAVWNKGWFAKVVGQNLPASLKWYGAPGAVFYELPHVELSAWRDQVKLGKLKLVE